MDLNRHTQRHHQRPSTELLEERCLLSGNDSPEMFNIQAGYNFTEVQGVSFQAGADSSPDQLAHFSSEEPQKPSGPYTYTVDWGDQTVATLGVIRPYFTRPDVSSPDGTTPSAGSRSYSIVGAHTYNQTGTYRIQVAIMAPDGTLGTANDTVNVVASPPAPPQSTNAGHQTATTSLPVPIAQNPILIVSNSSPTSKATTPSANVGLPHPTIATAQSSSSTPTSPTFPSEGSGSMISVHLPIKSFRKKPGFHVITPSEQKDHHAITPTSITRRHLQGVRHLFRSATALSAMTIGPLQAGHFGIKTRP